MKSLEVILVADSFSQQMKLFVVGFLQSRGVRFTDLLSNDESKALRPQELATRAVNALHLIPDNCCLLISRTGNSIQMHANKYASVSAAPCYSPAEATEAVDQWDARMCEISSELPEVRITSIADAFLVAFSEKYAIPLVIH